jgi:hypothetical protein
MNLVSTIKKLTRNICWLIVLNVLTSPLCHFVYAADLNHQLAGSGNQMMLAAKKSKKNHQSKSKTKNKKKSEPTPDEPPKSDLSATSSDLASAKAYRGLLGFFMGKGMAITFGAAFSMPHSNKIGLDGGFDYVKAGNATSSISMMRFGGGGMYIVSTSSTSSMKAGGRLGLARISTSEQIPSEFEEEPPTTVSKSLMSLYAEARASYEKKMGSFIVGGEVQLPLFFTSKAKGSGGLAIYGSIGKTL